MKAFHASKQLWRILGFTASLLLLAACSTDTTSAPNVQTTDFTVYVLATSEVGTDTNTLQATPWTLERPTGEDVQGQGKAVGENTLIRERVHTMQVSAQPGDELTLNVTMGEGETVDVGPFELFEGNEPANGEVLNQGDLTVVAIPASEEAVETASVQITTFNDVKLSGDAEVPPVETDASGEAALLLINQLLFAVGRFEGLQGELLEVKGSPAHIHQGAADENGDIVFNLGVAANEAGDGFFTGLGLLEAQEVARLQAGELYINIHSTFSESGELRGQIGNGELEEPGDEDKEALELGVAQSDEFGDYITDSEGNSLYLFTNDTRGANESTCNGECAETWPALTFDPEEEGLEVGDGLDADLLGGFKREDGKTQATYNGWPLYTFSKDANPGDTNGQGVGDTWFLLNPDGSRNQPGNDEPGDDETGDDNEADVQLGTRDKDPFGAYITDSEGNSLYLFTDDEKGSNTSVCNGECAETWPALTLSEDEMAGVAEDSGLNADLLGSFEREDGKTQVTYNGWPLYNFSKDANPGDTNGQGVGDTWFLVKPDGGRNQTPAN